MFALRGWLVCLSFFAVVYAGASALVSQGWRYLRRGEEPRSPETTASFLLHLRALPLLSAILVTAGVVLPSFLLLEPRSVAEPVGEIPGILGGLGLMLLAAGLANGVMAWRKTAKAVRGWLRGANRESGGNGVSLFRIRPSSPAMAVAGICEPRVLISDAAAGTLTRPELEVAVRHEMEHVRRRDNLKKLLLRFIAFPGMGKLEVAWAEAIEMAADDAAVSSSSEALDLASALIKISRVSPDPLQAGLTAALVPRGGSALNARIERLVTWQRKTNQQEVSHRWYLAPTLIGITFCMVMSYGALLGRIHEMTEWLVR
jgi:Zn-dependent protease with chaperone function